MSGYVEPTIDLSEASGWLEPTITLAEGRIYMMFGVTGDTNGDLVVDAFDFMALKQNFGTESGALLGEGDIEGEDGDVDWDDLSFLMTNMSTPGGALSTTPEPATLGLLAIGALAMLRRRRRTA